jgi:membrane protein DedA with SNARE-associated domain
LNRIKALTLSLICSAFSFLISLYILGSIDDPFATDNLLYFSAVIIFVLPLAVFLVAFNYFISKSPKDKE